MRNGCRPSRPFWLVLGASACLLIAGFLTLHTAVAASQGAIGASSRASAQIRLVIPSTTFRAAVQDQCANRITLGYVPIVRVDASDPSVPPEGHFVRCPSGASVFVVPSTR